MGTISTNSGVFTLINVFTVEPEHQEKLRDILVEATEEVVKHFPGYISANIHLSLDGTSVINYAQWRSEADFRTMHADPKAREHFAACREISKPNPVFCTVSYVDEARTTA
ncbi:antibiotic biosynthesis monooxygenase family protein [Amycolatopsis anabasis]|uniref:antibiotic biosynthesis monooxygenase family protein n=1 Tax=Amycolatopsis anabasis TaxID=1840409 RepID=UPI00131D93D7|nr:antibiotic biosynthesis monooxygenase family protein [Amycolatopsis anabasis]